MKKVLLLTLLLASCAGNNIENKSFYVLENEPQNCEYLYTLNTTAKVYDMNEAKKYLESALNDQDKIGDSYLIVETQTLENPGAVFGPKNTYKFKVKVFNCNI